MQGRLICRLHPLVSFPAVMFIISALVLVLAPSFAEALSTKRPQISCVNPVRLKMGRHIVYIHRPGPIDLSYIEPGKARDLCHATIPTNVNSWGAFVSLDDLAPGVRNTGNPPDSPGHKSLQLQVTYSSQRDSKSLYQAVSELLAMAHLELGDLPIENGFRLWKKESRPHVEFKSHSGRLFDMYSRKNIYIAEDMVLRSPKGEPAVIVCREGLAGGSKYEDCAMNIWDGEIFFGARNLDSRHAPKYKWKEIYKKLLQLRHALLTNDPRIKNNFKNYLAQVANSSGLQPGAVRSTENYDTGFCNTLLDDFKESTNFIVVEPSASAESFTSPAFQKYHLQCEIGPPLNVGLEGRSSPVVYEGTRNFQGYLVEADGDSKTGFDYILTSEHLIVKKAGGNFRQGEVFSKGTMLRVANLKQCRSFGPFIKRTFNRPAWWGHGSHALVFSTNHNGKVGLIEKAGVKYLVAVIESDLPSTADPSIKAPLISVTQISGKSWIDKCRFEETP